MIGDITRASEATSICAVQIIAHGWDHTCTVIAGIVGDNGISQRGGSAVGDPTTAVDRGHVVANGVVVKRECTATTIKNAATLIICGIAGDGAVLECEVAAIEDATAVTTCGVPVYGTVRYRKCDEIEDRAAVNIGYIAAKCDVPEVQRPPIVDTAPRRS